MYNAHHATAIITFYAPKGKTNFLFYCFLYKFTNCNRAATALRKAVSVKQNHPDKAIGFIGVYLL
jgi:hypothetical protein